MFYEIDEKCAKLMKVDNILEKLIFREMNYFRC